jgi:hypothetical protein
VLEHDWQSVLAIGAAEQFRRPGAGAGVGSPAVDHQSLA